MRYNAPCKFFFTFKIVIIMTKVIFPCFQPEAAALLDHTNNHTNTSPEKSNNKKAVFISKIFASIFQKSAVQKKSTAINYDFLTKFCNSSSSLVLSDRELSPPSTSSAVPVQTNFSEIQSSGRMISGNLSNPLFNRSRTGLMLSASPLAQSLIEVERLLPRKIVSSQINKKIANSVSPSSSGSEELLKINRSVLSDKKDETRNSVDDDHILIFDMEL